MPKKIPVEELDRIVEIVAPHLNGVGVDAIRRRVGTDPADVVRFGVEANYVWEHVGDVHDDYAALRVAERLDCASSESANLWQSASISDIANGATFLAIAASTRVLTD